MTKEDVSGWRARCCETLGLKGGAQAHEIKAAYRDLAKVWHPDRFTHDPRLQEKAQEKLKEINEAYRQLLAGTPPRAAPAPRDAHTTRDERQTTRHESQEARHDARAAHEARGDEARGGGGATRARRRLDWRLLAPALAFCATFAFVTPRLLSTHRATAGRGEGAPAQTPAAARDEARDEARGEGESERSAGGGGQKRERARAAGEETLPRVDSGAAAGGPKEAAARASLPTVSVTIDPATNLLARAGCPTRLRVTFPAGDEPHSYCAAAHGRPQPSETPAQEEKGRGKSRLKSFAGRVASPSKWLADKDSPGEPAKRSGAQEPSPQHD